MADGVFNIAKGAFVEKFRDGPTVGGVLLLKVSQAEDDLLDHDTLGAMLAANTEANFTNYARKTGLTGTITVDDVNNRTDVSFPDQTFSNAGGVTNNSLVKLISYYQESPADSGRIPLTHHDCIATTDGNDLTVQDILARAA